MKLIAGWLRARGAAVAAADSPTESQVLDSLESLFTSKAGEVTALGNENFNLTGRITALENEKSALAARNRELAAAIKNEQAAHQAERRGVAESLADLAIHRGIKTVAERDATIEALANAKDLTKDAMALLTQKPTHTTTTNGRDVSGKQSAGLETEQAIAHREYQTAFAAELPLCNQDPVKAHAAVAKKHSTLIEKLRPTKPAA